MFALSRILDQLTRLIATSKGRTDWQKYPKNRQSIRKQQPETLESKTCHAFPGKGVRLKSALLRNFEQLFNFLFCAKGFNSPPAHSNPSQAAWAYGSGVTRLPTARTLANSPAAAYFSIGQLYVATLQPPSPASKPS